MQHADGPAQIEALSEPVGVGRARIEFGSLFVGTLAEHLGGRAACGLGGILGFLAVGALVLTARRRR